MTGTTFNPKNLPNTKIGMCSHDDHESWTGDEPVEEKLRLMMYYSDEYNTQYDKLDRDGMSDIELDTFMEKLESIQYEPNSEQYWCEACWESLE